MRHLLNQTCTIRSRSASSQDAYGTPVVTWSTTTGVRCRMWGFAQGSAADEYSEVQRVRADYVMAVESSVTVQRFDEVSTVKDARGNALAPAETLTVVNVKTPADMEGIAFKTLYLRMVE